MGKNREKSNDITLQGVIVLSKKVRSDGHQVCLCTFKYDDIISVIHLDEGGHIKDTKCFILSRSASLNKKITLEAKRTFKIWTRILAERIDDYELGEQKFRKRA